MSFKVVWRNAGLAMFDPSSGDHVYPGRNVEDGLTAKEALARSRELQRWGHASVIVGPEGEERHRGMLQLAVWLQPVLTQFRT